MASRVLIVDDEADVNLQLKLILENNGFEVDTFNDPLEALSNFKEGLYDLLIIDIRMPKMNGFELYLEIKKICDKVKVCFLTALAELREYDVFKKMVFPKFGERHFAQKPIENEELINQVNLILFSS